MNCTMSCKGCKRGDKGGLCQKPLSVLTVLLHRTRIPTCASMGGGWGGVYFFLKAQFIPTENNFTEKSSGRIACLPSVLRGKGAMQEGCPVHL